MPEPAKRKASSDHIRNDSRAKRNKDRSRGQWQKQKASVNSSVGRIEPGDMGIWATCIKGKEGKAKEELNGLFEEYGARIYGITTDVERYEAMEEKDEDIESSIQREVATISQKKGLFHLFIPVHLEVQCVLFFKTTKPIVPTDFVQRICEDAQDNLIKMKTRFVNRLTPVALIGKANEKGLEELTRVVAGKHFQLADVETDENPEKKKFFTYAIRPTIRNHSNLKRDAVINTIASLISQNHKVDLTKPDRVILVEIFQGICGMCVVGNSWENLKRFNLAEIYQPTPKPAAKVVARVSPERVTKDESNP